MVKSEEKQQKQLLERAYWFTVHKDQLRKIGLIIFIIIDLFLVIFGAWGFIDYYFNPDNLNFVNVVLGPKIKPSGLNILDTAVIDAGLNNYNLVAKVKNPNDQWLARSINYRFLINNKNYTPEQTSFILANQEKYLMILSYSSLERIKNFSVVIDQISWNRLTKINDYQDTEIKVTAEKLTPLNELIDNPTTIQLLTFTATNDSIYNIREVGFQVMLLGSQNKVINANYLQVNDFLSFTERKLELNIFNLSVRPREILIIPEINFFDQTNFFAVPVAPHELFPN